MMKRRRDECIDIDACERLARAVISLQVSIAAGKKTPIDGTTHADAVAWIRGPGLDLWADLAGMDAERIRARLDLGAMDVPVSAV